MRRLGSFVCAVLVCACSGTRRDPGSDPEQHVDGGSGEAPDASAACPAPSSPVCVDHHTRRVCQSGSWSDEVCPDGSGCVQGQCVVAACSDECTLGQTREGEECTILDMSSGSGADPDPVDSLHDRARAYADWLWRVGIHHGGVGNARFAEAGVYDQVSSVTGLGDSAIWTGTYLAAEALRLMETGASDAHDHVVALTQTLHTWFDISGQPGLLVRYVAPSERPSSPVLGDVDCEARRVHCGVSYQGQSYDLVGHISRDQYQGVMLGYSLAYEALGEEDEATRALIREDVVTLVEELMKMRTVPARITIDEIPINVDLDMRFVVLAPDEFIDGRVDISVNTSSLDDGDDTGIWGLREFVPNLADVLRQVPGLSWVPDIPRSSPVMLASFFQIALEVTDGVPGYEDRRAAIASFYTDNDGWGGNVSDWLDIAKQWSYNDDCGAKFYANNIVMEPMYDLARLDDDPDRGLVIRGDVLRDRLWATHKNTKNPFFSFIYAETIGAQAQDDVDAVGAAAVDQLAQFPPPPRVRTAIDLTGDPQYESREDGCTNQLDHSDAVDVGDRAVSDFLWQRNPWELVTSGDPRQLYPGVDYLVAYWLGRHAGYITDDTPSTCAVWK